MHRQRDLAYLRYIGESLSLSIIDQSKDSLISRGTSFSISICRTAKWRTTKLVWPIRSARPIQLDSFCESIDWRASTRGSGREMQRSRILILFTTATSSPTQSLLHVSHYDLYSTDAIPISWFWLSIPIQINESFLMLTRRHLDGFDLQSAVSDWVRSVCLFWWQSTRHCLVGLASMAQAILFSDGFWTVCLRLIYYVLGITSSLRSNLVSYQPLLRSRENINNSKTSFRSSEFINREIVSFKETNVRRKECQLLSTRIQFFIDHFYFLRRLSSPFVGWSICLFSSISQKWFDIF